MEKEKRLKEINEELAKQNKIISYIFGKRSKAYKLIKERNELSSDPELIKWCENKLLSIKKSINYTMESKKCNINVNAIYDTETVEKVLSIDFTINRKDEKPFVIQMELHHLQNCLRIIVSTRKYDLRYYKSHIGNGFEKCGYKLGQYYEDFFVKDLEE